MEKLKTYCCVAVLFGLATTAEAFSGDQGRYYVSGHLGYGSQKVEHKFSGYVNDSASKNSAGLTESLAFGYHISNDFRMDLSFFYMDKLKSKKKSSLGSLKSQDRHLAGFVNGYYDLFSDTIVMPYFTGGFGLMQSTYKSIILNSASSSGSKSRTKMAYQAGIGLDVHVGVGWTMDASYRLMGQLGKRKFNFSITDPSGNLTNVDGRSKIMTMSMLGLRKTF